MKDRPKGVQSPFSLCFCHSLFAEPGGAGLSPANRSWACAEKRYAFVTWSRSKTQTTSYRSPGHVGGTGTWEFGLMGNCCVIFGMFSCSQQIRTTPESALAEFPTCSSCPFEKLKFTWTLALPSLSIKGVTVSSGRSAFTALPHLGSINRIGRGNGRVLDRS